MTHAAQMLERTLDDSSNKRLVFPELFLAADALLVLAGHVCGGLVVYPAVIGARVAAELPFIVSEDVLLSLAARGGDRQALHERIRRHAQAAGRRVKLEGRPNDLVERLQGDAAFRGIAWERLLDARRHVGLAPRQTREFLRTHVRPVLRRLAWRAAPQPEIVV
ncbi:MAG TPA: adenylosuccinate lyase, partial [Phycisphaerae bacterium]|nr:adenylosuccinate lyase [Phycisphaerae bacterium]